jgi:solute carrier family 26, other
VSIIRFPTPTLPDYTLFSYLLKDAIIISVIALSISMSLSTLFARKNKYKIDSTQVNMNYAYIRRCAFYNLEKKFKEMYALGASNVFGSVFSCFPSAGSLSRSGILNSSGAKSQVISNFLFLPIFFKH